VLRRKEAELRQLQEEVEALRMVGRLLLSGRDSDPENQEIRGKILQMPGVPITSPEISLNSLTRQTCSLRRGSGICVIRGGGIFFSSRGHGKLLTVAFADQL